MLNAHQEAFKNYFLLQQNSGSLAFWAQFFCILDKRQELLCTPLQCLLNYNYLGILLKMQILIQAWGGCWQSAFLISSQMLCRLLAQDFRLSNARLADSSAPVWYCCVSQAESQSLVCYAGHFIYIQSSDNFGEICQPFTSATPLSSSFAIS